MGSGTHRLASEANQSDVCGLPALEAWQHMKHKVRVTALTLERQIGELEQAPLPHLKQRWRELYGTQPPRRISRDLLIRALAYRMQEQVFGGLKPSSRRLLARVVAEAAQRREIRVTPQPALKSGAILLREWHGIQYRVVVRDDGIVFQGKRYASLSQIAQRITGTKWSGPRFFGLRAEPQEQRNGTV